MAARGAADHALLAGEGELFVPYTVLPDHGSAMHDVALAVRLRSLEGLRGATAPRLSLAFRFGPPVGNAGLQVDKSKEVSVKCQMELIRERDGTWLPEGDSNGGVARIVLPPMLLSQAARGVVCRLKVTTPGFVTAHVLAVSAALPVPLEPGAVPLAAAKAGRGGQTPVATAMMSVSRLFSAEAQADMARGLVQQLLSQLRRPASGAAAGTAVPPALDALRPSCGWLPAAGLPQAFAATDNHGRSALRLAVDGKHWACVQPLIEASCDLRGLSEDLHSPLTVALERGGPAAEAVLGASTRLSEEARRVAGDLSTLLAEHQGSTAGQGCASGSEATRRWEALAEAVATTFRPPLSRGGNEEGRFGGADPQAARTAAAATPGIPPPPPPPPQPSGSGASLPPTAGTPSSGTTAWSGDIFILALEHCPTGKARRKLLCAEGACAALWRVSLSNNLPSLARKLAVWIGLSVNSGPTEGPGSPTSRRRLLDVQVEPGVEDAMLARSLERGLEDERWLKVARVMVHLGADVTGATAGGRSLLLLALEQADRGNGGFRELLASLLEKLGDDVDQWEQPTFLVEENTAECPICMEVLWTSTPTAFVSFAESGGGEGNPHLICGHFFCFDCASQQYMKQQSQNVAEFQCPICRAPAREVMPLPDITINPRLWFQFLDVQCQGRIEKNVVIQTLEAMLPIDTENLREALEESVWAQWDKARDDSISEREFFDSGGLLEWVRRHQHDLRQAQARGASPTLADEPEKWFRHWDSAKRGRLRRGEVLRALCEAARVSSLQPRRVKCLKEGIDGIWERHAADELLHRDRFLRAQVSDELEAIIKEVIGGSKQGGGPGDPGLAGLAA